jgi:hypothetical protein
MHSLMSPDRTPLCCVSGRLISVPLEPVYKRERDGEIMDMVMKGYLFVFGGCTWVILENR